MSFAVEEFNREHKKWGNAKAIDRDKISAQLKWSEALLNNVTRAEAPSVADAALVRAHYRPFVSMAYYSEPTFSDRLTRHHATLFGEGFSRANPCVAISAPGVAASFRALASDRLCDWHFMGDTQLYGLYCFSPAGDRIDNITDWALDQFTEHYPSGAGKKARPITKESIFHYVYAVLHDPLYRDKYAQNLKREFPRIPLYGDSDSTFWHWAGWGAELMALHIGYEAVKPFALTRTDEPDAKVRASGQPPKPALKADKGAGRIVIDSETTLTGIPAAAWGYQLGNRCALEWVLDQHKEKKPKDPTIRAKFDTYRLADYKERVIELLMRVATVSVETVRIVDAMKAATR